MRSDAWSVSNGGAVTLQRTENCHNLAIFRGLRHLLVMPALSVPWP
jgi:hypothetical protein